MIKNAGSCSGIEELKRRDKKGAHRVNYLFMCHPAGEMARFYLHLDCGIILCRLNVFYVKTFPAHSVIQCCFSL